MANQKVGSTTNKTTPNKATSTKSPTTTAEKKSTVQVSASPSKRASSTSPVKTVRFNDGNVKLFSHLERPATNVNLFVNNPQIHPSIARLGEQYAKRAVVGSNARCMAFLSAVKMVSFHAMIDLDFISFTYI